MEDLSALSVVLYALIGVCIIIFLYYIGVI